MKPWVKQIVTIRSTRFYLGCFFATAAFALSLQFYDKPKAGLLFALMFVLTGAVTIPDNAIPQRYLSVVYVLWLVFTAFVTLALSQFCMNEGLPVYGLLPTVLGIVLIAGLFLISISVFIRIRVSTIIVASALLLFSCVNYFVCAFRGSALAPADILSIATAGNVAAEYSFRVPSPMFYAAILGVAYFFASYSLPPVRVIKRRKTRVCCLVAAAVCAALVWMGGMKITPLHWLNTGTVGNGFLLNFTVLFRETFPQKPRNYSPDEVTVIANGYNTRKEIHENTPDILVIMDESFADLGRIGEKINTDIPVTPFIDNLKENTLRGYSLSSVFGGGTPNSEYEFLTGNTFLFLPTGSIAYQQFIKEPSSSMASELKNRGYSTIAMHQYLSSSWMRASIWPLLGFDKCLFRDGFPQKDFLRNWGTDQEMFEKLAAVYEEHRETSKEPVFMFGVTIQNHGGYDYAESDFSPAVHLQGYSQDYPDVEQYLTCIHETDRAVQWLIQYFEQVDRNVVILFYGDHYPKLNESFIEEVHGKPFETLDEQMLQYEVPFFIWTNYESKPQEIELVSMNYLSGLLYQRAGLKLPTYRQYLEQVRQTIPACNAFGYYSLSEGSFLPLRNASGKEKQALLEYSYLEWNSLFDTENRNELLFPVN